MATYTYKNLNIFRCAWFVADLCVSSLASTEQNKRWGMWQPNLTQGQSHSKFGQIWNKPEFSHGDRSDHHCMVGWTKWWTAVKPPLRGWLDRQPRVRVQLRLFSWFLAWFQGFLYPNWSLSLIGMEKVYGGKKNSFIRTMADSILDRPLYNQIVLLPLLFSHVFYFTLYHLSLSICIVNHPSSLWECDILCRFVL